jgi:putative RNA 2'-phosphotransferase
MILVMTMSNRPFDVMRASKFLSYVLQHRPESIGILLDKHGLADVPEVPAEAAVAGIPISLDDLRQIVALNDKKRFFLSDYAMRIRAAQDHSINVDLKLTEKIPLPALYQGTIGKFIAALRQQGLQHESTRHLLIYRQRNGCLRGNSSRQTSHLVIETFPMLRNS